MPFTLSHAVLAPPISKLTGGQLPIAALAIGSMTPDLYRLFTQDDFDSSHLWQSIFTLNLAMGLLFCGLWYLLYRPFVLQFLNLNKPLKINSLTALLCFVMRVAIALIIGAATHIIWDGLTHSDFRTFAFKDFLNRDVILLQQIYPMHRVLQIGSSIAALPFLIWMGLHYYFKYQKPSALATRVKYFGLILILTSFFSGCFAYIHYAQSISPALRDADLYSFIGRAINQFSSAFLISFSLGCLLFQLMLLKNKINK